MREDLVWLYTAGDAMFIDGAATVTLTRLTDVALRCIDTTTIRSKQLTTTNISYKYHNKYTLKSINYYTKTDYYRPND